MARGRPLAVAFQHAVLGQAGQNGIGELLRGKAWLLPHPDLRKIDRSFLPRFGTDALFWGI